MTLSFRRRPARPGYWPRLLLTLGTITLAALHLQQGWRLAIDSQWIRCMQDRRFLIDIRQVPRARDLAPGDRISFAIGPDQASLRPGWEIGRSMGKIVLAARPGIRITVGDTGVAFETPEGASYHYGTGLEAAAALGQPPDSFHRTLILREGELWVMGEMPWSLDSRYYGPIREEQITGRIVASW